MDDLDRGPAQTPAPRNPVKAGLLSLLLGPGAGQIYNGQMKKAKLLLAAFFAALCYAGYKVITIYAVYYPRMAAGDLSAAIAFAKAALSDESVLANSKFIGVLWLASIADAVVCCGKESSAGDAAAESVETKAEDGAENPGGGDKRNG